MTAAYLYVGKGEEKLSLLTIFEENDMNPILVQLK